MRKRVFIIMVLAVLLMSVSAFGQSGGTTSPLASGVGARDLALGAADIATCDYTTAPYWNPSRLARSEQLSLTGFHTRLYDADIAYQYLGIVIPTLDWGSFGIGVIRLGVDNIEERDASNLLTGTFDDNRLGFRLAYGQTVGSLDLGLAVSMENHTVGSYKATSSPGLDIAVSKIIGSPFAWCHYVTVSVVARNIIAPSMKLVDEEVKSPAQYQIGLSTRIMPNRSSRQYLEVSGGFQKTDLADADPSLGLEYSILDMLKLRGSLRGKLISGGVGLAYHGISVDYAVVDRDMGALHMISLTTAVGKPATERRLNRTREREAAFSRAMNDRLTKQNIELASQLLASGKTALASGDLRTADSDFDRALFLSRSSGIDTTESASLLAQVQEQITRRERNSAVAMHLDSARVRLSASDYLGCQYFAGLALALDSSNIEAIGLHEKAGRASSELSRRQEFVQHRVLIIDSLIGYGRYDEALSAARSVNQVAPDNPLAQQALKKAEFELFRYEAEAAMARQEYRTAIGLLDSALTRFPGQNRCLALRQQCRREEENFRAAAAVTEVTPAPLSREIEKQVADMYEKGRAAFNRGDLPQAMKDWEEVDRLAPGYQAVREYLVKVYRFVGVDLYSRNQMNEALKIWEKALAIAPDNTEIAAYARRTRNEIDKLKELSDGN
ncbi:exported hypothetical protein [Candidatus Zixiibacteriota bacterium]|nr:exported hypothetical protein [candidate division Zixibacteria bacterium]